MGTVEGLVWPAWARDSQPFPEPSSTKCLREVDRKQSMDIKGD